MLSFYRDLPISTKLLLSNLAFALPMAVLIFFMNISFIYDINIGKKELAGINALRPLFGLLDHLPDHFSGEKKDQGGETAKLQARIVELISATGRDYLLSLDPALDSKLLADLLTDLLPRNWNQLNIYSSQTAAPDRQTSSSPEIKGTGHAFHKSPPDFSLFQADVARIIANARLTLQEDAKYYGVSPSLHTTFAQALDEYQNSTSQFIALHQQNATQPVEVAVYQAANTKVRLSCRQLALSGIEELEILINKRITSYRKWQVLAFSSSALALLLASILIYTIAKGITVPIKAVIGYTRQISNGEYQAHLDGDFQGELKGLTIDLKSMVHEIIRLASFPRENPTPVLASTADGAISYLNHLPSRCQLKRRRNCACRGTIFLDGIHPAMPIVSQ